ncbi:MAG: peptide chain release factor 1 [Candidatus Omnitrophica bacterium]|nr:peptide chain release factor 1 [Candidatus Omnitrophota bacterium]
MLDKLKKAEQRYLELEQFLADPAIINDKEQYQKLAKEYSDLTPLVVLGKEFQTMLRQEQDLELLLKEKQDPDFESLAQEELKELRQKQEKIRLRIDEILNPKAAEKNRNMIIEIRAGTGGQEASLFAADLFRMYTRFADRKGWKVEMMESHESDTGGFKEVIFSISGKGAEKHLKWESGAHRVQRVPATEASGRIHTSAATVAVMAEAEEIDVQINPADLRIDIFRSSGPGGQSVNTTDSAVRLTHIPTGLVVICQDERSQLKNKNKAMRVLRARLLDKYQSDQLAKETKERRLKIGTGDRSDKIRTYNFSDHRVTDHRIGFTSHRLDTILDGDLDELTNALIQADAEDSLNERK